MLSGIAAIILVVAASALPPAPQKATIAAPRYGAVTLDHASHVRLRIACKSCHGSGRIGAVQLGADAAHKTCKGCHRTEERGPMSCRGCHARSPTGGKTESAASEASKPPENVVAQSSEEGGTTPGVAVASSSAAAESTSIAVASDRARARTHVSGSSLEIDRKEPPPRRVTLEVGLTALHGTAQGPVVGPFLQLRTRWESLLFTQSIEMPGGTRSGRTLGLLGAGKAFALAPGLNLHALGLAGFDIVNSELAIFPACGIRTGVEWMRSAPKFNVLSASVTVARDLGGRRHQSIDAGTVWSLTLTAGNEALVASKAPGRRR